VVSGRKVNLYCTLGVKSKKLSIFFRLYNNFFLLVFFIIIYLLFHNLPIQALNDSYDGNYEESQKPTDSTEINELQETTFNSSSSTNFCRELSSEQDKSPEKMKPPKFTPRKKKRSEPLLENALVSLDEMAWKIKNEDACDKFGKICLFTVTGTTITSNNSFRTGDINCYY
jgi:hypothetical protein